MNINQAREGKDEGVYEFCGEGLGVPGLPHRVTMAEARAMGLVLELEAAIAAGNYRQAKEGADARPAPTKTEAENAPILHAQEE